MAKGSYLLVLNIIFAAISVIGQVGENVSLPFWTGATSALGNPNCSDFDIDTTSNSTYQPSMDPFFVLSFASLSFVVIFGAITAVMAAVQIIVNHLKGEEVISLLSKENDLKFPQWQLILIGVFDALNGVLVVFASLPSRTAPFLQAILGNFIIPLTIIFRLILLRKVPTLLRFLSAIGVLVGLGLSLVPVITGQDEDSKEGKAEYLEQSHLSQILWPLCFMFGFFPAAIMNVIEEKSLKDTRKVNLFYLLFCTSVYQLLTVWLLFWVDIIPHYGFADSLEHFGQNYKFALRCFFGGADCGYQPGLSGTSFISLYVVAYIGGGLLLRYSDGATYLAIVQSLVTPLGALFWSIFSQDECAKFHFHPHADSLTYYSIAGMVIMVPSIFFYNIGTFSSLKSLCHMIMNGGRSTSKMSESEPLLTKPPTTINI